MGIEDRRRMRARYDDQGEREWERLQKDPQNRVAYEIHRRFLNRFIKNGDHVLEVAPARSLHVRLANLGATVEVTDFSPVQLELHRQHLNGTTAETLWRREHCSISATPRSIPMPRLMPSWPTEAALICLRGG